MNISRAKLLRAIKSALLTGFLVYAIPIGILAFSFIESEDTAMNIHLVFALLGVGGFLFQFIRVLVKDQSKDN